MRQGRPVGELNWQRFSGFALDMVCGLTRGIGIEGLTGRGGTPPGCFTYVVPPKDLARGDSHDVPTKELRER